MGGVLPAAGFAAGVLLLALGLVTAWSRSLPWGIGLVAAAYIGSLYTRGLGFDAWSLLVALALVAASELAHWSIDSRLPALDDVSVHVDRAVATGAALALCLVPAVIVEAAAALGSGGLVAGVAALVAVLLTLTLLVLMVSKRRIEATAPLTRR